MTPASLSRCATVFGETRVSATEAVLDQLARRLGGRRLVVLTGDDRHKGGVYEIVRSLLTYLAGAGIDVLWLDIDTDPNVRPALEYFHVLAHGHPPSEHWDTELPEHTALLGQFGANGAVAAAEQLRPSDVVFAHDTQTVMSVAELKRRGWPVIWHSHIGSPLRNRMSDAYWDVFAPALAGVDACVFYLPGYIPAALSHNSVCSLPAVDPSSRKNTPIPLHRAREQLLSMATDDTLITQHCSDLLAINPTAIVGAQLSRWDALKDMAGVLKGFGSVAAAHPDFHGMVVGPQAQSANEVAQLEACLCAARCAPTRIRDRLHVVTVADSGTQRHDDVVRLVQCASDVVTQKSLQEGFGLTVTEAMLKGKPVVASNVGGIPAQIRHQRTGLLVDDPSDVESFAASVTSLGDDPARRRELGAAARASALHHYSIDVQLRRLGSYLVSVVDGTTPTAEPE